jgi:hypothetical protein
MPFIGEKFDTYHEFASASLTEIYEPEIKKKPFREVNFLDSAIFWNQDGKYFEVQSLPTMAQMSPAFGVAVADFDNDSFLDIFLANNFFASQPETGFMDGGLSLLLRGAGNRKFVPAWPNESGIAINVASYGAALADFDADGDQDIAVSTNNDRMRLLENKAKTSQRIKIQLKGSEKNRQSIGAKVLLIGKDFQRAMQVSGGSSYLSQSSSNRILLPAELSKRIEKIDVIWPDGQESTHKFEPNEQGLLQINK